MTLEEKWQMDKVLPPFWVTLKQNPTKKIVISKIVLDAERPTEFFEADSKIPWDSRAEIKELGHLPSSRMRLGNS